MPRGVAEGDVDPRSSLGATGWWEKGVEKFQRMYPGASWLVPTGVRFVCGSCAPWPVLFEYMGVFLSFWHRKSTRLNGG